tara:strand:+ start:433 stop:648 length:216 start_codon:yes stop_codon:yes gene_type:complete
MAQITNQEFNKIILGKRNPIQEYRFKISIEGVSGYLYYSVDAESEQEAHDMVSFFLESAPKVIERDLWDNN